MTACGMAPADLALAIERHATSKLPEEATLFRIATLGFRGEALPSIGAVARLSITSRPAGGAAHRIAVEGGHVGPVAPAAGAPGTRVEVRDLFFATPARRKFLRHPRTEAERAVEAVRRLALAWPGVTFRVESDGREVAVAGRHRLGRPHPPGARAGLRRRRGAGRIRGRHARSARPGGAALLHPADHAWASTWW